MRPLTSLCDYFVICHGQSRAHLGAIMEELTQRVKRDKMPLLHVEGTQHGQWIIVDCGDVIVHVFSEQARTFYDLEGLWSEAPVAYQGSPEDGPPAAGEARKSHDD